MRGSETLVDCAGKEVLKRLQEKVSSGFRASGLGLRVSWRNSWVGPRHMLDLIGCLVGFRRSIFRIACRKISRANLCLVLSQQELDVNALVHLLKVWYSLDGTCCSGIWACSGSPT